MISGLFGGWHGSFVCNAFIAIVLVFAIVILVRSWGQKT